MESFTVTEIFPVKAAKLYKAWLDSRMHSQMTGGTAVIDPAVGGAFTAWDGYIQGKTVRLEPDRLIVQSWRTDEFPEGVPDSTITLQFEQLEKGARLTLEHVKIPDGQGEEYKTGWLEYYFKPMMRYFSRGR